MCRYANLELSNIRSRLAANFKMHYEFAPSIIGY